MSKESSQRAVIYVESGTSLRSSSSSSHGVDLLSSSSPASGSNYVIKIQIGEEPHLHPVRIDVSSTPNPGCLPLKPGPPPKSKDLDFPSSPSSGASSPRSDHTTPPPSSTRMKMKMKMNLNLAGNRFGSETSESDLDTESESTESDISSTEFGRGRASLSPQMSSCSAAQFALREICEVGGGGGPPPLPSSQAPVPVSGGGDILGAILSLSESMAKKRAAKAVAAVEEPGAWDKMVELDEVAFHVNEMVDFSLTNCSLTPNNRAVTKDAAAEESLLNFAGVRDIFAKRAGEGTKQILSDKGTIRGVKNRVRDGIATFLQSKDTKTYSEKEQGRVVVYTTSMGVVRSTFLRCQKVKQILRNLLVKFDERDCYMNRSIQNEIRHRIPTHNQTLALPQVFLEGQLLGDADGIEKLNETGELRDLLKPYKSLSVLSTCEKCGGFRMLPCPICNGSKKSVHRNHFTTEFIALKCMHCDPSGLVRCDLCNAPDP